MATDRLRETDALPLSDDELAFVRRHEATVCCCERTANHVSPEQAVKWGEPGRIDEARWLATVDDRDSEIRLAAAAYTEQQCELMDAYDDFGIVRRERDALESERDAYRKEVERQGSALRAVAELVQRWRRDIDPANQVDKHEPFYDEGIEDSADELEMTLKAALAQTEPQT